MLFIDSMIQSSISLVWFYLIILIFIILIKKIFHLKVIINTIWFSVDGSVSEDALFNLIQLSKKIEHSHYKTSYQLWFWTDTKKLKPEINKKLKQYGIKIKDYRAISCQDELSYSAIQWVENLLSIGNQNNKLFFMLASDIFRLYLLLKEFPRHYKHHISCYIDCNDIIIHHIPNPRDFLNIQAITFHFVEFNYADFPIFKRLVPCPDQSQVFLTNDVIIARNKRTPLFNEIFSIFCQNLMKIQDAEHDLFDLFKLLIQDIKVIDTELGCIVIFATTHIMNTLYIHPAQVQQLLIDHQNNKKQVLNTILDSKLFLDFTRDYTKGYVWLEREATSTSVNSEQIAAYRTFWFNLFIDRYKFINQA